MKKHILSKKCWCKPDVISFNQAMNKKIDSQKMDIYPKMSNYTQHETHTACIDRIKKEGASVTCCDCNPHEGCTLNDRLPEASKTIDTQTDWEDKIRFLLENLIVDIGIQVTDDYKNKNGLYEGMSIKNARSRDKYIKLFINLLADARREVITTKIDRLKLYEVIENIYLSGLYSHDKGVLHQYMSDIINVLATLKEEQI